MSRAIEVHLKHIDPVKVGNQSSRRSSSRTGYVLVAEWDSPNPLVQRMHAAFSIKSDDLRDGVAVNAEDLISQGVENASSIGGGPEDLNQQKSRLLTRLFKTEVSGLSRVTFTLIGQNSINTLGRVILTILGAAAGSVTGGLSGIGGALASSTASRMFDIRDKWDDHFGEHSLLIDSDNLDEGEITIPLGLTDTTVRTLERAYTERAEPLPGESVRRPIATEDVREFIAANGSTANVTLSIRYL